MEGYGRLAALIEHKNMIEEDLEEHNLAQELEGRVAKQQWCRRSDGMSLSEFYQNNKDK